MKNIKVKVEINKGHDSTGFYPCIFYPVFGVLRYSDIQSMEFSLLKLKKFIQLSYSLKPKIKNIKVVI